MLVSSAHTAVDDFVYESLIMPTIALLENLILLIFVCGAARLSLFCGSSDAQFRKNQWMLPPIFF